MICGIKTSKMGHRKIYLCIVLGYLMVTAHGLPALNEGDYIDSEVQQEPREDAKILVVDTNMSNKNQQQALELLKEVLNNHADKNYCKQYALGFAEVNRNTKWGCFRFPANENGEVLEGSYYTESSEYIELAVTTEDSNSGAPVIKITHYLLFLVRKW